MEFVQEDLTTAKGREVLAKADLERLGGIDNLAHFTSGSTTPGDSHATSTDDRWTNELNLTYLATVHLDRLQVPQMNERGSGSVVHVSSIQSVLPLPEPPY